MIRERALAPSAARRRRNREDAVLRYVALEKQQQQALADFAQRTRLVTGKDPTIAEREAEVKRLRKDLDELITTDLKELQAAKAAGDVRLKTLQDFGKIVRRHPGRNRHQIYRRHGGTE